MSPDAIERILDDFRTWLSEAREIPPPASAPAFDLATIVQHFTALRQEVNLQTRASRTQTEISTQTLERLQQAIDALKERDEYTQGDRDQTEESALRPVLKALVDARDSLSLARREVQRMLEQTPTFALPPLRIELPAWARMLGLQQSIDQQLQQWVEKAPRTDEVENRVRKICDSLLVGYQMSLQRLERVIQHQGLEPIRCVGLPFDPETMEVAEVVREEGRSAIEVIDEIRPGYRWRGQLFRYAQVRVAKP